MTSAQTVSSEVEVAVDPATAFHAFTEEMDLWWVRGPINFWSDGGRVVEVRCEPGVGGRIIEVLDDPASGEVLERARLTQWEPGVRLAWESELDDVQTEVRFAPIDGGTRVTVEHFIPADGEDRGGTAWSRVVPGWFGAWCAMRDRVPHQQIDIARLALGVSYARPAAAARWLADVFGFRPADDLPARVRPAARRRARAPVDRVPDREREPHGLQARRRAHRRRADARAVGLRRRPRGAFRPRQGQRCDHRGGAAHVSGVDGLRRRRSRREPLDVLAGAPDDALTTGRYDRRVDRVNPTGRLIVDITALARWRGKLTGIQRVVDELSMRFVEDGSAIFVVWDGARRSFRQIEYRSISADASRRSAGLMAFVHRAKDRSRLVARVATTAKRTVRTVFRWNPAVEGAEHVRPVAGDVLLLCAN